MALRRRRRALHEQLAEAGGIEEMLAQSDTADRRGTAAQVPVWNGVRRSEAEIHGVPRARNWDVVSSAEAPGLPGNAVHFVALPDGTLVVDEELPDDVLAPLAEAVEASVSPPYRAEAVRREAGRWAVAARTLRVVRLPGLDGEEAELVTLGGTRTLTVDGYTRLDPVRPLQEAGEAAGRDHVVRARRLDDELWEVETTAL